VTTFFVLLIGYTVSQFFRSFLAVVAPELASDLSLTANDLGQISATWFIAFALAQFPVGYALDRAGPRRTVPVFMLCAVVGSFVFASARNSTHCIIAMALIGIGCAPVYMGALYLFGRLYPAQRFALLSSWLLGIGSAGNLLSATPLAYAMSVVGWRAALLGVAALTLLSAAAVFIVTKDPPRIEHPAGRATGWGALVEILSIRALWPILPLTAVSYALIAAERGLWIGPYLAEVHRLAPIARGNATLTMAIAMTIGALLYGPLDQIFRTRKWVVLAGNILTGLAFVALGQVARPGLGPAVALLAVIGGAGMSYAVLMAHARPFFPEHLFGRGITFMNFVFIGGAGLIQVGSGAYVRALEEAGGQPAEVFARLHTTFGLLLLAASAIYVISKEKR
jgi:nitrate/nitrite transporter NarK